MAHFLVLERAAARLDGVDEVLLVAFQRKADLTVLDLGRQDRLV
jgi:hypothetical protein